MVVCGRGILNGEINEMEINGIKWEIKLTTEFPFIYSKIPCILQDMVRKLPFMSSSLIFQPQDPVIISLLYAPLAVVMSMLLQLSV